MQIEPQSKLSKGSTPTNTPLNPIAQHLPVPNPRDIPKVIMLRTGLDQVSPQGVTNVSNNTLLQALAMLINQKLDPLSTCLTALEGNTVGNSWGATDPDGNKNILYNYEDYNEQLNADHQTLADHYQPLDNIDADTWHATAT